MGERKARAAGVSSVIRAFCSLTNSLRRALRSPNLLFMRVLVYASHSQQIPREIRAPFCASHLFKTTDSFRSIYILIFFFKLIFLYFPEFYAIITFIFGLYFIISRWYWNRQRSSISSRVKKKQKFVAKEILLFHLFMKTYVFPYYIYIFFLVLQFGIYFKRN